MSVRTIRLLAERQLGLVTTRQLHERVSVETVRTAERRGWLVRVRPHVYRFAGAPPSWQQSVLAAVLVAGPEAVASHETAAALWGVPGFPTSSSTAIHVTVPRGRRPYLSGIRVHGTTIGPGCHRAVVDRVPVTGAARTCCDLDGVVPVARLGTIVDDLLMRRTLSLEVLAGVHAELRGGARRSKGTARVLAERGAEWNAAESPGEARLARWLTGAGLPAPVHQHEIDGFRVDLAYPDDGVFIEYDGFVPHATRTSFDHDRRRANRLALSTGATILRFTSASNREEVVRDVTAALRRVA